MKLNLHNTNYKNLKVHPKYFLNPVSISEISWRLRYFRYLKVQQQNGVHKKHVLYFYKTISII